jgi:hypothetical protein
MNETKKPLVRFDRRLFHALTLGALAGVFIIFGYVFGYVSKSIYATITELKFIKMA